MFEIRVPILEENSETSRLVEWQVKNGDYVKKDDIIAEIESTKTVEELRADKEGYIYIVVQSGDEFTNKSQAVAYLFDTKEEYSSFCSNPINLHHLENGYKIRATKKAISLSQRLGVDLSLISKDKGIITENDVENYLERKSLENGLIAEPKRIGSSNRGVILIGAGGALAQALEILDQYNDYRPVAIVDDVQEDWGRTKADIPIVGGLSSLITLIKDYDYDSVLICITDIEARVRYRTFAINHGFRLINAIDKTTKIATNATVGSGNIICAFCHIGAEARIGDNNFISAYNSFDHHNIVGNDNSTGPGCMMSGNVRIGSRVRFGAGIFVEPRIEIGDDVKIASGAIIRKSIAHNSSVKLRIDNYTVTTN